MTAAITDFTQFAALRQSADSGDPAALREVAGQFEALFLQSMLESMREATPGDPLFGDSDAQEMYESMLDQQLALEMASGKGIGIAELLVRQLGGEQTTPEPREPVTDRHPPAWSSPESFAREVWPHAERAARRLGLAPESVLAQAALETGWGRHVMTGGDGNPSFNLFGIKAAGDWSGDSVVQRTLEFDDGIARAESARFRSYDDVGASFDDYAELLAANPRYAAVRGRGNDIAGFAGALQSAGYATDPDYAAKISRVATSQTMSRVLADLK